MPKKRNGIKKGKTIMPIVFQYCYPNYKTLQKGVSIRKLREMAKARKVKPKRDPRYIPSKKVKIGTT